MAERVCKIVLWVDFGLLWDVGFSLVSRMTLSDLGLTLVWFGLTLGDFGLV